MNKQKQTKQQQLRVGTPTHIIRLARKIDAAAKTAGLKTEIISMAQLDLIRVLRGNRVVTVIDIIDVPEWNLDDRPQPLAVPTVKLHILPGISNLEMIFTEALCAQGVAHSYAFVDARFDQHIILQLKPEADIDSAEANERIATIVAYRRRTRRRIFEQGLPPIAVAGRSGNGNGYHRNGKHAVTAKTAFGQANMRLRQSGIRVTAN